MTDDPSDDGARERGDGETVTYSDRSERPAASDRDGSDERALPAVDESSADDPDAPDGPVSGEEGGLEPVPDREPGGAADGSKREPLGDLADAVGRRREAAADDGLFEREDVTEVDGDAVWDRIERDEPTADLADLEEREIREIEKRSYCHQCEHFDEPPAVACTNEGTEILAMPSLSTFRVADCPVVLEEEELEAGTRREDRS